MTLLIDNYDSFSYNLYQYIGAIDEDIKVVRNDELSAEQIRDLRPKHIIISPGPGKPSDAGVCISMIKTLYREIPILGICLGHQAIFEAFGGTVSYASKLMHGKASSVILDTENAIFKTMPEIIKAGRYHSLAGIESTLPEELQITARTDDGEIMAVCGKNYNVYGVQFHPESILTPNGNVIIGNFLKM
jgi:anthranilate synthase component 2